MSLAIQRTPDLIAAEINHITQQTRQMVLYNAVEVGRRLCEAKQLVPHGEWGKWLEDSVDYSQSSAQNFMRIFEEYGANQIALFGETGTKSEAFGKLSYTQAVALLGVPADEREAFVEDNNVEAMSTRELQKAIKERDQALEDLKRANDIADEKSREAKKNLAEKQVAESDVRQLQADLKQHKLDSKNELEKVRSAIANAQESGDDQELERLQGDLEKAEDKLEDANKKIAELEEQLAAPIETAVVEKVPESMLRELEQLRKNNQNPAILKFSIQFEVIVKQFNDLIGSLASIKASDAEAGAKYSKAVADLLGKMGERL